MTLLSDEAIAEFKAIYKEEFGEELTDEESQAMGAGLLRMYSIMTRPPRKQQCGQSFSTPQA